MDDVNHAAGLLATSAVAVLGYLAVSARVPPGRVRRRDVEVRRRIQERTTHGMRRLAEATGHIGKWYVHVPIAAAGALALARRGRLVGGVAMLGAALGATALSGVLDHVHAQPATPPGKDPHEATFPSGHALETTAVGLVVTWVLAREGVARPAVLAPVAALAALISGGGRLALDRHWITDSAGGYCAGFALGAACAGGYELARSRV